MSDGQKSAKPVVSEGTASAQRIEREYGRQFRPMPITVPSMEVEETDAQRVRRVLSPSGCTQDCNQGRSCTCRPAKTPSRWLSWRW